MLKKRGLLLICFLLVLGPFTYQKSAKAQGMTTPSTIRTAALELKNQYAMSTGEEDDEKLNEGSDEENDEEYKQEEENSGEEEREATEGDLGVDVGGEEAPGAEESN